MFKNLLTKKVYVDFLLLWAFITSIFFGVSAIFSEDVSVNALGTFLRDGTVAALLTTVLMAMNIMAKPDNPDDKK